MKHPIPRKEAPYCTIPAVNNQFSDLRHDEWPHLLTSFDKFDGHLLACGEVDRQLHETKGPFVQIPDLHIRKPQVRVSSFMCATLIISKEISPGSWSA